MKIAEYANGGECGVEAAWRVGGRRVYLIIGVSARGVMSAAAAECTW